MKQFNIRIAGLDVCIEHEHSHVARLCEPYAVAECGSADIFAVASAEEIIAESQNYNGEHARGYCESICIYRSIAEQLPQFDGFVFHGAAVEIGGRGVIFTAPSGTGKTTHISLLFDSYPDEVKIINGDKPIIRKIDGEWRVCSTPWAGKEGMQRNTSAPLDSIVILGRGEENRIERVQAAECFDTLIRQVYYPQESEALLRTLSLLDTLPESVRFFKLSCNMSPDAARTSFEALK